MEMFLPVGSVVSLKDGSKRLAVVGRCLRQPGSDEIHDYAAVLFPEGMIDSSKVWLFDEEDIERVWFVGMQDEEEFRFRNFLYDKLNGEDKD